MDDLATFEDDPVLLMRASGPVTIPEPSDRCLVTFDQIDRLHRGGEDRSIQVALAAVGACVGFIQNFIGVAASIYQEKVPTTMDAAFAAIFIASAVVAIMAWVHHHRTLTDTSKLVERLKSGKRVKV